MIARNAAKATTRNSESFKAAIIKAANNRLLADFANLCSFASCEYSFVSHGSILSLGGRYVFSQRNELKLHNPSIETLNKTRKIVVGIDTWQPRVVSIVRKTTNYCSLRRCSSWQRRPPLPSLPTLPTPRIMNRLPNSVNINMST